MQALTNGSLGNDTSMRITGGIPVLVRPDRPRPVQLPVRRIPSATATSVVHVACDSDLDDYVRSLEHCPVGPRQWLVADLTTVESASQFAGTALVTALDRLSPNRFCIVAAPRSPWVVEMLPQRARRVTFQSMGDALQMLVLVDEGFGAAWLGSAVVRPIELDVTQSWLARCPLAVHSHTANASALIG